MSDLAEFLLARIAEDEADARRAASFKYDVPSDAPWEQARARMLTSYEPHQARWSPARALAECEAKRRMVELAEEASMLDGSLDAEFSGTIGYKGGGPDVGDRILLALALPYADHPDYREEWRAE